MAAGRIFEIAFAINAAMQNSFTAILNRAGRSLQALGNAAMTTNQQLARGQRTVDELSGKLRKLQGVQAGAQRFTSIQQSMQNAGNLSARALANQSRQLERVKGQLEAAGFSVSNFAESERKLRAEIEQTERAHKIAAEAQEARMRQMAAQQQRAAAQQAAQSRLMDAKMGAMNAVMNIRMVASPFIDMAKTAMTFQAAMSKVQAITNATAEDTQRLTDKARELGATTRWTATQSAEAMTYLGMAGWKTEQIMAGMKPMLDLATAGGTDLARTADIISDDLTAFGMSADQAGRMADVFAYTITNSNTTVELMGESMKYAAPVAKAFGASMEETAAMIGLMANAGIKGSMAGTSLRQGFLRLAGPPAKASHELEALGINLSEAQREMQETQATLRGLGIEMDDSLPPQQKMVSVIRQLADKTSGLKNEQKLAALQAIFGTTAASGWLNVINQGPDVLEKLVSDLQNCDGTTERIAGTMENNAQGAATRLNSAIESLSISLGSTFLPAIADAAGWCANIAGGMAKWAGEHPKTTKGIIALGAALLGLYGYWKLTTLASAAYSVIIASANASTLAYVLTSKSFTLYTKAAAVAQWALNAAMSANPIGLVILGIAALIAAGYLLIKNWNKVKDFFVTLWDNPAAQLAAFMAFPIGTFIYLGVEIIRNWEAVKAWFTLLWNDPSAALEAFVNMVKNKFSNLYQYVAEKWEKLKYVLSNPITAAVNFVEHGNVYGSMTHSSTGMSADEIRGIGTDALGGIYNRPRLTWVAEAGYPEAIVPLDGSRRAFGLWQKAGEMLGAFRPSTESDGGILEKVRGFFGAAGVGSSNRSLDSSVPAMPITVNLTINGNANPDDVRSAAMDGMREASASFAEQIAAFLHEKERTSFA